MKLLLDVGNTAVKWGLYEADGIESPGRFEHRAAVFDEIADRAWSMLPVPDEIIVASVAGVGLNERISHWFMQQWQREPTFIQASKSACGVTNAYHVPGDLGVDRWAGIVGAYHGVNGSVCVVDCGTAITIDLVRSSGEHCGGLILPGVAALRQALLANSANIELSEKLRAAVPLARGTPEAVSSGVLYLAASAIERIVSDMTAASGESAGLVMTGGDAERLLPLLTITASHTPDLVLQGLATLSNEGN